MNFIKKIASAIFAILTLIPIVSHSAALSDDALNIKILGTWAVSEEDFRVAIFKDNGTYIGKIYTSPDMENLIVMAYGKWWIKDGLLHNQIEKLEPSTMPAPEEIYIDQIIEISDKQMVLIDSYGQKHTKTKIE